MLLGLVQTGDRGFLLGTPGLRAWENAWFFQDDWKFNRRLTLNLGVRYELYSPETEWYDRMTSFDMRTLMFAYANEDGYSRTLRNTDRNNFGPRFGFAYDVTSDQRTILRGGYALSFFPEPVSASNMLPQGVPHLFSEQFAFGDNLTDYSAVPRIDQPFGPLQPLKPRTTAEVNARRPTVRGYSFENPTQYAQTWSMTLQRQVSADWMVELGYVGSRGLNLLLAKNHNEVLIGSGSVASGGGSSGGPNTITCIRCFRGPSGFDVKHRMVVNTLYDLPWGRGRQFDLQSRFLDAIIGGWQLGGIITATTGRPFNVSLQNGVNNGAPSWPNRIADGRISGADRALWFDPSAFVAPPPNTSYGNVARGVFYSPGVWNFDTSVTKTFNITEKVRFNFRWEAFNLFNTPYFGFPNAAIGSPTVGQINGLVGDNRSMQFAGRVTF